VIGVERGREVVNLDVLGERTEDGADSCTGAVSGVARGREVVDLDVLGERTEDGAANFAGISGLVARGTGGGGSRVFEEDSG
jgi:hypothetical protein